MEMLPLLGIRVELFDLVRSETMEADNIRARSNIIFEECDQYFEWFVYGNNG